MENIEEVTEFSSEKEEQKFYQETSNSIASPHTESEEEKEYKKFMYNRNNICNCICCPENKGMGGEKPCGQQRCWVEVHVDREGC